MRVKCLAQGYNTMSPARARNRTARSGDERTNHEASLACNGASEGNKPREQERKLAREENDLLV